MQQVFIDTTPNVLLRYTVSFFFLWPMVCHIHGIFSFYGDQHYSINVVVGSFPLGPYYLPMNNVHCGYLTTGWPSLGDCSLTIWGPKTLLCEYIKWTFMPIFLRDIRGDWTHNFMAMVIKFPTLGYCVMIFMPLLFYSLFLHGKLFFNCTST